MQWFLSILAGAAVIATVREVRAGWIPCFLDSEAPSDIDAQWQAKPRGIVVSWTPNTDRASGYRVYRMTVLDQGFGAERLVGETSPQEFSFLDKHAHPKLSYRYRVVAFNACGESPFYDGNICRPAIDRELRASPGQISKAG